MFEKNLEKKYVAKSTEVSTLTHPYLNTIDDEKQEVAYRVADVSL